MKCTGCRRFSVFLASSMIAGAACIAPASLLLASETQPTTAPNSQTFQDSGGLIRLQYPAEWKKKDDADYVLSLTNGSQLFTLDIPDLPVHVPGMIPLSLVVNGYIDDLKKSHPGIK